MHSLSGWLHRGFILLLFSLFITACQRPDERDLVTPDLTQSVVHESDLRLAPAAVALDAISQAALVDIQRDSILTFSRPQAQLLRVQPGSVLLVPPHPLAPYGLLRKVTQVSRQGDQLIFTTVQAHLGEAIESGRAVLNRPVETSDLFAETFSTGVTRKEDSTGRISGTGFYYEVDLPTLTYRGVDFKLAGDLWFNPEEVFFDWEWGFLSLERMETRLGIVHEADWQLLVGQEISMEEDEEIEFPLATQVWGPFLVGGVVPIFLQTELEVEIKAGIQGGITFNTSYKVRSDITVKKEDEWDSDWNFELLEKDHDLRPSVGGSLTMGLEPELTVMVFSQLSVELEVAEVFLKVEIDPYANPCWALSLGAQLDLEVKPYIFGWTDEYGFEFPPYYWPLFDGPCLNPGHLSGLAKDAVTGEGLSDVTITVWEDQDQIASGSTGSDGSYHFLSPAGDDLTVNFSRPGYLPTTVHAVEVSPALVTYLEAVLQVDAQYSGQGDFGGTIIDALTGQGLNGALLTLRPGLNRQTGASVATTSSGSGGQYLFSNIPAGNYTVEARKDGYITAFFSVVSIGNQSTGNQNGALTPELAGGQVRIVLDWGAIPSDLDSHLTGPYAGSTDRFHVYYANMAPWNAGANLDLDDVSSYGPETITITEQRPGVYRYSVHNFTNRGLFFSTALAQSGARVRVFIGSAELGTFNVPNQPGTLWTVFEMTENTFTPLNEMSYESSPSAVRNGVTTDGPILLRLPEKGPR